jgi:hypothetical protein
MAGPDLLERIDRIMAELAELRAAVAGAGASAGTIVPPFECGGDDLADGNLIDTHAASARFGHPADSIRKWCREENIGVRRGGRWLVDPRKLRARINGG